jgi:hypothetical protein
VVKYCEPAVGVTLLKINRNKQLDGCERSASLSGRAFPPRREPPVPVVPGGGGQNPRVTLYRPIQKILITHISNFFLYKNGNVDDDDDDRF